jgi:hypothetical protein
MFSIYFVFSVIEQNNHQKLKCRKRRKASSGIRGKEEDE